MNLIVVSYLCGSAHNLPGILPRLGVTILWGPIYTDYLPKHPLAENTIPKGQPLIAKSSRA